MTREEIRAECVRLYKKYNNVILEFATGTGKTICALSRIELLPKGSNVLIVVPEIAQIINWKEEFKKWKIEYLFNEYNINIICYASLPKYKDYKYDLIILDEAHHSNTDIKMDALYSIKCKSKNIKVVALSATISNKCKERLYLTFGDLRIFRITIDDAIKWNILPIPKIRLIPLELDFTRETEVIEETRGKKSCAITINCNYKDRWNYLRDKKKYPNLVLRMKVSPWQKYEYLCDKINYYKKLAITTRNVNIKNKWMQYCSERKLFLGNLKTAEAKKLVDKLGDARFICYCTNIKQAQILGGKNAIHSKEEDSLDIIDKFNKKEINSLFSVQMVVEGMNLKDIEKAVIVQLDGKDLKFIQKLGRALRAENPEVFVFYYKNTRDEEYLKNVLENIDNQFIE